MCQAADGSQASCQLLIVGSNLRAFESFESGDERPAVANCQFQLSQIGHQRVFTRLECAKCGFKGVALILEALSAMLKTTRCEHCSETLGLDRWLGLLLEAYMHMCMCMCMYMYMCTCLCMCRCFKGDKQRTYTFGTYAPESVDSEPFARSSKMVVRNKRSNPSFF